MRIKALGNGQLRAATEPELDEARGIAQKMILAYLKHLG
jgi:hypothetical protein